MLLASLIKNSGWMKFLGVFLVVYGVIVCISVIGIVIGWIPIWLGVLLFSSAERLALVKERDSEDDAVEGIEKISLFFKISGIVTLVYVGILVIGMVFGLFFLFSATM